jgi:hypothetical protein
VLPKGCGVWRGFSHLGKQSGQPKSEDDAGQAWPGHSHVNGALLEDSHQQRVPPTLIKKERRRSKEEWMVVATQPKPEVKAELKQARVREVWSVGTPSPSSPAAASRKISEDLQHVSRSLPMGSPDVKSPRKQVTEFTVCNLIPFGHLSYLESITF